MLFAGLADVIVAPWNTTGVPGKFRELGEIPPDKGIAFEPKQALTSIFGSSPSAQRAPIARLKEGNESMLKLPLLEGWNTDNLALQLLGESSTIAAGSNTGFTFPTGLVAGDLVRLPKARPSSLVLTDSAVSPETVDTADYSVDEYGIVTILNVASYTQPFKAAWSNAVIQNTAIMTADPQELWIMAKGVNTVTGVKFLVEFYRVSFDAAKVWELIQLKGAAVAELEGLVLADPSKLADSVLGQFGRVQILAAA